MPRSKKTVNNEITNKNQSLLQKLQEQLKLDQSYLSLVLGLLIVVIAGILVFNYFKTNKATIGPSNQIEETAQADVTPDNLPGKYTVKNGDTLFTIAQKYYNNGFKYTEITKANNLTNADSINTGQVLEIPKLEETTAAATPTITQTATSSASTTNEIATGGSENQTTWGEKITGNTYTVVEGDWLSKISGRAYGDIMQFNKLAEANNIANPDLIQPGMVLKIPR
ncbi:MAG: LysM peptidoglycan-binding domain-containing protein [Candidatus Daviesbacteria bacterium]|nr:LysM peptidoglycan-binding domain-containing protein [Candidatus Daviesbacteria bacterium]